eukprot:COSAG02_NODE_252_length_26996_cov_29.825607_21_plen_225_part_00
MPKRKKAAQPRVGGDDPRTASRFAPAPGGATEEERRVKRERRRARQEEKRRREQLVRRLALGELEALRAGFGLDGPGWGPPAPPSRQRTGTKMDAPLAPAAAAAELRLAASDASLRDILPLSGGPSEQVIRLVHDAASAGAPGLSSAETVAAAMLCEEYMDHLLRPYRRPAAAGANTAAAAFVTAVSSARDEGAQIGSPAETALSRSHSGSAEASGLVVDGALM